MKRIILFGLCILSYASIFAQMPEASRPVAIAHALSQIPTIDGDVLNDPVWQTTPSFGDFWQTKPNAGKPASEKTEIRIGFTTQTFYLAVVCFDATPEKLVASDARRDASLDNTDSFRFILDTYHDGQNGFIFGTNPIAVEYDAQVDNEGQGNISNNRQQGGSIGGFNLNWDASWTVKTMVGDFGWSAEFAIPLKTLRFKTGENQTWGINFQRIIRKNNEVVFWASLPIEFDIKRLSLAGTLTGLHLQSPGNLKVIPYVLGQAQTDLTTSTSETQFSNDSGVDVKYSLTPSMTLDLTYNTDFAQVEVDEQQINLDRFNLFFPEKRPFFLENAGLFTVGSPGEVELFFSRRIGIGTNGTLVPILGGARVSGKLNKTNIGFLNMATESVTEASIPRNNFTVGRISHEFAARSAIGGIVVNRQGFGDLASENDYNRTVALDGKWGLGNKAQLSGYLARSFTPEVDDNQHAFQVQADYQWQGWMLNATYAEVAENFNPEVGFLQRTAFRKPSGLIFYRYRPEGKMGKILELRPHVSYRGYWDFNGFQETGYLHIDNHWAWQNGMEIHTGVNFTTEGVTQPFEISSGVTVPAGTYKHSEAQLVFQTNQSNPIALYVFSKIGGFFGGDRIQISPSITTRMGDAFNAEFSFNYNDVSLPYGDFQSNLLRARLSYSFTPRIFVQSLLQYNGNNNLVSSNLRFGWLQAANTGLFLVFNAIRDTESGGDGILNRSFVVKYTRLFDIIR